MPETDYSFNQLISAQAAGDRAALAERDRVVLAIDLGRSGAEGLEEFTEMLVELADGD